MATDVFTKLPTIDSSVFRNLNIPLPKKRAYAFRLTNIYDLIDPALVKLRKEAIINGRGEYVISLGGDTGEKEIFGIMPADIGKSRKTSVCIYDIRPEPPKEYTEKINEFSNVDFNYITGYNLEDFQVDDNHINNTRLCNLVAVTDYMKPGQGVELLEKIKKVMKPDYFFFGIWLAAPDIDITRNPKVAKEIEEMRFLLSRDNLDAVNNLFPIAKDELLEKGQYPLGWTAKECADYNLFPEYPGTSFYPLSVIRYFNECYKLARFSSYRVESGKYPREAFFLFKKL